MKLIDERTPDGSRHFARLPRIAPWKVVRDHVLSLGSARVVNDVGEGPAEPWLDFTFRGHRFLIHCHENQFRLTVRDPQCSDLLLFQVGLHFQRLLNELGEEGMGDEKPGGCARIDAAARAVLESACAALQAAATHSQLPPTTICGFAPIGSHASRCS